MKAIVLAAGLALAAASGAQAAQVGGVYNVQGTNFDGGRYGGTVSIKMTSNSTCRITWNTGANYSGICMVTRNTVAASYQGNGSQGMVVYQILGDGTLDGIWTIAGENGSGTETLFPK